MAREDMVKEVLKKTGYHPLEGKGIIVKFAPENLSDQIVRFFSTEYYVMQICEEGLVLVPFSKWTLALEKKVALEIPRTAVRKVTVTEEYLNYRIALDTEDGVISLSAQQAELSEFRSSGLLACGISGVSGGLTGVKHFKVINWHRNNLQRTLEALEKFGFPEFDKGETA